MTLRNRNNQNSLVNYITNKFNNATLVYSLGTNEINQSLKLVEANETESSNNLDEVGTDVQLPCYLIGNMDGTSDFSDYWVLNYRTTRLELKLSFWTDGYSNYKISTSPEWVNISKLILPNFSIITVNSTNKTNYVSFTTMENENKIICYNKFSNTNLYKLPGEKKYIWLINDSKISNSIDSGNPDDLITAEKSTSNNYILTINNVPAAPNGRGEPLKYSIEFMYVLSNKSINNISVITLKSLSATIKQDGIDALRQEYFDMSIRVPKRTEFDQVIPPTNYSRLLDRRTELTTPDFCRYHNYWIVSNLINCVKKLDDKYDTGNLRVTCGFRCPLCNKILEKTSPNSFHLYGRANDYSQHDSSGNALSQENYTVWKKTRYELESDTDERFLYIWGRRNGTNNKILSSTSSPLEPLTLFPYNIIITNGTTIVTNIAQYYGHGHVSWKSNSDWR